MEENDKFTKIVVVYKILFLHIRKEELHGLLERKIKI